MHGKTFSRNDLQHTKDPTDQFFVGFDKAIIRFSRFPLLLACQAPPKIAMHDASLRKKHRASQPKPSLGAPKNEASSALERQKCLRCCAEENRRCRGVSKHLPPKSHFFFGQMDATLSQTVKWSHTWVLQPLVCRMRGTTSGLRFKSRWKKSDLLSIAVPFWSGSVEQKIRFKGKVPILSKEYTRLAQFFMTSDFLKRDLSVFHWHGYKCMIFDIFE